jgi:multicomponent K+:H+ antiporter subunit D
LIENPNAWVVVPILIPLAAAALMLMLGGGRRWLKAVINLSATLAALIVSVMLLIAIDSQDAPAAFGIYLPGDWPVPFGIVFVIDRFSALMAVLTGCVGLAAVMYSLALWHQAGVYFHVLFQLQLMGLYGAFLTGDLFNLFVFFEVLLAASYGLLLHGGGSKRVRAGLHYVAVNLVASLLFLIGVAVLYGVTGTLNIADMALKLHQIPEGDRGLLHAGAAILALAFLVKAALWPLNGWLPGAYTAASAPVAAVFAILTKVGVYAVVRLWTLCFPADAGVSALFGMEVLVWGGIITVVFGAIGMFASLSFERLVAFSVITSAGTLVAAMGFDRPALGTGALFYMASSTLAGCALFLLVELLDRTRQGTTMLATIDDGRTLPQFTDGGEPLPGVNLDDDEIVLVGRAIPFALAFLGVTFAAFALIAAGMPPLSGFVSKVIMLLALLDIHTPAAWTLFAVLILSGLLATIALMRVGMRHFWSRLDYPAPRLRVIETLPIALLLTACIGLVAAAEPVYTYMRATADALHSPVDYIDAVLDARPISDVSEVDAATPGAVP